ncbi:acyltransferase family protein [Franconibacter daqui]|uniref:acyltransferase family protein n=1 Tax=Franconibacter daqui TaxID=2047724 RepID=UPI002DBC23F6|nr:acyltransferase [Franconibacter daqui]MEB5922711.1 acyltransferase [Franconibacter daqui]
MVLGKVKSIHYLRGIAALMVVFYHLKATLNDVYAQKDLGDMLFNSGAFGVDLFFIISGFIICYSTERKESFMPLKYLLRRFFRIYPLLFVSLIVTYLFISNQGGLSFLLRSAIPLNTNYDAGSPFFGYNLLGPAWTLSYEIAFYALFLLSFVLSHRFRWLICSGLILLFVLGVQYYYTGGVTLFAYNSNNFATGTIWHAPLTFLSSPLFINFIYGLVAYKLILLIQSITLSERIKRTLTLFSLFVFLISSLVILSVQVYGHGPLLWGAWCFALVVSALIFEMNNELRDIKPLSFLGDVSYSLYLTHAILIEIFRKNPEVFTLFNNQKGFSQVIYLVTLSLFVAYFVHHLIEKPFISVGKMLISKIGTKRNHKHEKTKLEGALGTDQ